MQAEGHTIPELEDQPELFQDLMPYYRAFSVLSSSRESGFSIGYIKYSEIVHYLNEENIYGPERLEYIRWVQFIDGEFVALKNDDKPKPKARK